MKLLHKRWFLIIICLLALCSLSTLYAQTEQRNDTIGKSYVTFNLLAPLDVWVPRWRMGYVKKIDSRWKAGLDFGYGDYNKSFPPLRQFFEKDYRLWEVRSQLYFIINPERKAENYVSVEFFYVDHKDVFGIGHYFPVNGYPQQYDGAHFHRQKFGVNVIHGFFFFAKWRIGVNGYIGMGVRVRHNAFTDVINPRDVDLGPEGGDMAGIDDYKNVEGVKVGVNPVLGIKLYYKLHD